MGRSYSSRVIGGYVYGFDIESDYDVKPSSKSLLHTEAAGAADSAPAGLAEAVRKENDEGENI